MEQQSQSDAPMPQIPEEEEPTPLSAHSEASMRQAPDEEQTAVSVQSSDSEDGMVNPFDSADYSPAAGQVRSREG